MGDLGRFEDSTFGLTSRPCCQEPLAVGCRFQMTLEEASEHGARAQDVGAHAIPGMIDGDGPCELTNRRLCRIVDGKLLFSESCVDAGDGHDRTVFLFNHKRDQ
ncbi:hypothetical protein D9M70_560180 [compost metagenome]